MNILPFHVRRKSGGGARSFVDATQPIVAHVITGLGRGGAEQALFRLLSKQNNPDAVRVVSLTDGGVFRERLEAIGVSVTCLGMRPGVPSPIKWMRLVGLLRQWRPQLVQTWMYHADLLGGLAAKVAGVPVCWGLRHSDLSRSGNKRSTLLVVRCCASLSRWLPARIVSCSQRAVDVHRSYGYVAPFVVVPNGLPVDAWLPEPVLRPVVREELRLENDAFVFVHVGRNHPQKDHVNLARAFNRVQAAHPGARLLVFGEGLSVGNDYWEALPFTPEARRAVLALGARDDLPRMLQAADAFVLSSLGEGFPNAVAEAMACGLPCVVTDVGDAADIVGDTGIVVPPMNSTALAEGMLKLLDLQGIECARLGLAARQRILEMFTLERMATGFSRVWNEVIAEEMKRCAD